MSDEATVIEGEIVEHARALPAVRAAEAMIARGEVSVADVVAQREKITQVMAAVMKEGVHYGLIRGVSKPTLLKPGAEVLAVTLRLASSYSSERTFHEGDHLTVVSKATLTHIPTGLVIAEGEGLCTTREKKYAYRGEGRTCPSCGASGTIKKSKYSPREKDYPGANRSDAPGWYCHAKTGGCGANFAANDSKILDQSAEKTPNPDLADTWNTILKMANKRALVAAILNGTAASDIFTQDVEDVGATAADTHKTVTESRPQQPQSWKEINEWAGAYGVDLGWSDWLRQAAKVLFDEEDSSKLSTEQLAMLGARASTALTTLRKSHAPTAFPPPARPDLQKAWASAIDGTILVGPEWRMSPDEEDRPEREVDTPDIQPTAEEQADAEAIPFGED